MKHKGNTLDFAIERLNALMTVYDQFIAQTPVIRMSEVYTFIAQAPAPRFFVSEQRALAVLTALRKSPSALSNMNPLKIKMYQELNRRYINDTTPGRSAADRLFFAINSPAPSFYLTPGTIKVMITKYRPHWHKLKHNRLTALSSH